MTFELFMNFNDGQCREAMEFYAAAFKSRVENVMTFGEAPEDPSYPIKESEKDRIMYASVKIGDKDIMFMDMSSDFPLTIGNNIVPCINVHDHDEIDRLYTELSAGGTTIMAPQKQFFSDYYTMFIDKFGVTWQILVPYKG